MLSSCSLAPQASPWGAMDGAAAGNMSAPGLSNSGQPGSNANSVAVPSSQPSPASWGITGNVGASMGQGHQAQQQWVSQNSGRDLSGASMWPQWPTHSSELAMTADKQVCILCHAMPCPLAGQQCFCVC